jgi:hypothetical protein
MLGSGNWDAAPLSLTVQQQQHDQVMALIDDDEDDEDQHLQQIELTHKHACSYCGTCVELRGGISLSLDLLDMDTFGLI